MSQPFEIKVPLTSVRWFVDSPDVGDPACLCSWCGKSIIKGVPIRMYRKLSPKEVYEARFHDACCEPVLGMKIQSFDDDDEIAWPDDDHLCYCNGDEVGHDPDAGGVYHINEQVLARARRERGE